ncbi:hypothetical protein F2Q68_00038124 [Brassica cretica]|uniref:Nucleoside phosphorylase domain-containing protein n=2 Tax=Brassica cretica TaxID=69181 RepID=A0A8S9H1Z6_BRACR|nr:hypothetical protein F2Q68_00038124 [Brassica cretica]
MGSHGDEATEKSLRRPISTVVFVIAMQAEAQPLVNKFGLSPLGVGGKGLPWVVYQVFLASHLLFHHRRIPIPMFDLYGVGLRQAFSTPNLLKDLNLKGAAVAYVAELLKVPVMFLKAVTDLIDGDKPTAEEFLQNLSLEETATKVINGKTLSDL